MKDEKEANLDLEKVNHALWATFAQVHNAQGDFGSRLIGKGQQVVTWIPEIELPDMVVTTNQNIRELVSRGEIALMRGLLQSVQYLLKRAHLHKTMGRRLRNARNDLIQLVQETEHEHERRNRANTISPHDISHIPNMYADKFKLGGELMHINQFLEDTPESMK